MALAKNRDVPFVEKCSDRNKAAILKAGHNVGVARLWGHGHISGILRRWTAWSIHKVVGTLYDWMLGDC